MVNIHSVISIITLNVSGLNTPIKRQRYIWKHAGDVIVKCQWEEGRQKDQKDFLGYQTRFSCLKQTERHQHHEYI